MKNLKRFEELSPETYKNAASRLRNLGFTDRSKALNAHAENDKSFREYIYEMYPGHFFRLSREHVSINGNFYKEGDEKFFKDDTIVIDVIYIFEERGMNNVIRLDFQFIIDFRSYTISINKNGVYGNDDESINKRAGNLIKKNLLSKMFDKLPMSELFMIRGVSSVDYKKVVDCVENINLNELCSRKDIYLLRKHLLDWK